MNEQYRFLESGFCLGPVGLKAAVQDRLGGDANVWYTQRNGDCFYFACLGQATPQTAPACVSSYTAIEWIDPDDDGFGLGNGILIVDCGWRPNKDQGRWDGS